jgi:protoporphyrin/coproporphyrin ferrochelatase
MQTDHGAKIGVLLANLGTPDSPTPRAVRRYLRQFLWDPRVVELPRALWWPVLNLVILTTRPRRSARAYAKVWTEAGSPLLVISRRQQAALQAALAARFAQPVHVALGMCYGNPSIADGLAELQAAGITRVLVLPLYPQYSATSTAAVFDAIATELRHWRVMPELRYINDYHDHPAYISALADSVRTFQAEHGTADRLLMSFHGIPQDYADKGDPYPAQCDASAALLATALELGEDDWMYSFQSRLGPKDWLKPYTDHTLEKLAKEGTRCLQVVCPGFSADCLETLEEIAMQNRDAFVKNGGVEYRYIPCLNDTAGHIELMVQLVEQHTAGWC